eukprot:m.537729 g.537729  ORF g.537729 m.537729 type:complete len:133 (+) comp22077_c0_seq30:2678-3076(+)
MTELLLSDVTEKHERLQQAWVIPEQDVIFEEMLASGAFGTVWKGRWGHIPVAVKKLKLPLDGLDPVATEDFDREVSFMQSIRHPNLLIFYGAGVTSDGLAFLVGIYESSGLAYCPVSKRSAVSAGTRLTYFQ